MKIMNQLQEICGLESEEVFSPEDEERLRELEGEYKAQQEPFSQEDEELLQALEGEYRAQEKAVRQKRRERVVLGRWNQLLLRVMTGMLMLLVVPCVWRQCSIWDVLEMWLISELLWCGVREFYRAGDLVIHEIAVVCGVLLPARIQSQEKALYAFGISCILSVIVSNNLGTRMWQGKPAKYNENIAKLIFVLCTVMAFVFCYNR